MIGLGRKDELNETDMRKMAEETNGTYQHARNEQTLIDIFENLSIQLHDNGVDEHALAKLAEATGGKYKSAQDISQLQFIYSGLADELQTAYTVTFPSWEQDNDGTSRKIEIRVGDYVVTEDYNVSGVVVPEMDAPIYLGLLVFLGALLVLPAGMRRFTRTRINAS
jgi:hypothetical protein